MKRNTVSLHSETTLCWERIKTEKRTASPSIPKTRKAGELEAVRKKTGLRKEKTQLLYIARQLCTERGLTRRTEQLHLHYQEPGRHRDEREYEEEEREV